MAINIKPIKASEFDPLKLQITYFKKRDGTLTQPRFMYDNSPFALEVGSEEKKVWMGGLSVYCQETNSGVDIEDAAEYARQLLTASAQKFKNYFTFKASLSILADDDTAGVIDSLRARITELFKENAEDLLKRSAEKCSDDFMDLSVRQRFIDAHKGENHFSGSSRFMKSKVRLTVVGKSDASRKALVEEAKAGKYAGEEGDFVLAPEAQFYEDARADKKITDPIHVLAHERTVGKCVLTFEAFNLMGVWYVNPELRAAGIWRGENDGAKAAVGGGSTGNLKRYLYALSDHTDEQDTSDESASKRQKTE